MSGWLALLTGESEQDYRKLSGDEESSDILTGRTLLDMKEGYMPVCMGNIFVGRHTL